MKTFSFFRNEDFVMSKIDYEGCGTTILHGRGTPLWMAPETILELREDELVAQMVVDFLPCSLISFCFQERHMVSGYHSHRTC